MTSALGEVLTLTSLRQICEVVDAVLADPIAGPLVQELNPGFKAPARPFMRLDYKDAIAYLNEHNILFQDDDPNVAPRHHQIGDDIAEAAERKMTDDLNVPIFLMNFPKHLKSFYMKKIEGDEEFTESVDVLMPNVGEIVGELCRIRTRRECLTKGCKLLQVVPCVSRTFKN
jgi:asparaginyl-tRNA synthetase